MSEPTTPRPDPGVVGVPARRRPSRRTVVRAGVASAVLLPAGAGTLAGCRGLRKDRSDWPGQPDRQPSRADLVTLAVPAGILADLALSPDGRMLAASGSNGGVWLWDVTARRSPSRLRADYRSAGPHAEAVLDRVAFSPDGRLLAFSDERDRCVRLWDVAAGQPDGVPVTGRSSEFRSLRFSPDGGLLAVSGPRVELWDVATRRLVGELGPQHSCATFSPDGRLLATIGVDPVNRRTPTIQVWNAATRQPVGAPITSRGSFSFHRIAFSPDGGLIASHDYKSVRFWDVASRQAAGTPIAGARQSPDGPPDVFHIHEVAFGPAGGLLATSTTDEHDGAVRLWDPATHQPAGEPLTHLSSYVAALAFDQAGRLLAIGDGERIRLWTVPRR